MKRFVSIVLFGALVAGTAGAAGFDNKQAGIALHIAPANSLPPVSACNVVVIAPTVNVQTPSLSTPVGPFFWTYLLVCNGSDSTGVAGMEMGINYNGAFNPTGGSGPIDVFGWIRCADLEFADGIWPGPGGSDLLTWTTGPPNGLGAHCHHTRSEPAVPRTVIAIGGYFYMGAYAPSQMFVTPRPVSGRAKVADCNSREDDLTFASPSHLGIAGFGGAPGYNPCGAPTPVTPSTWSGIKTLNH
jgi:hypothetical protein